MYIYVCMFVRSTYVCIYVGIHVCNFYTGMGIIYKIFYSCNFLLRPTLRAIQPQQYPMPAMGHKKMHITLPV